MALIDISTSRPSRPTSPDTHLMHAERYRIMRLWSAFFQEYPILLSPTWAQPAFAHGADIDPDTAVEMIDRHHSTGHARQRARHAGGDHARRVVDGLPVGVQVMGDRFTDLRCLTIAAEIESLVGTLTPIDPITPDRVTELVALDLPGGPEFVDQLQRIWDAGDAAFPVDQRLPERAKETMCHAMRVGDEVEPGDALVVATSGSTGAPKGVVLTHDAVAASATATSERLGVTHDDHWLACLPLSHVGGLSVVTRGAPHRHRAHGAARVRRRRGRSERAPRSCRSSRRRSARIDPTLFRTIVLGGSRPPDDRPAELASRPTA